MVRLKGLKVSHLSGACSGVSIPYGTIERYNQLKPLPVQLVSIPYGTIESLRAVVGPAAKTQFQFLMVRLKVNFGLLKILLTRVSIPYGTIERPPYLTLCLS